jgi:REP element-mobilizing transposase RayT
MTRPRNEQISVADTQYYHIVSRCVRRSYLCGVDHSTGKNYEHRRQWIENRVRLLASIFGVQICAYAIMSNHLHIVLKLCPEEIESLSNGQVAERWASLFKGPLLIQKWRDGESLDPAELQAVGDIIAVYRKRLADLGWLMKSLNEPIARQANKEDGCTGHFWEARYKSQALHTEEAVLSCMAYVDLNPIRAGMAKTPETSEHTSIKERIAPKFNLADAVKEQIQLQALITFELPVRPLAKFEGGVTNGAQVGILFSMKDYLDLVDFTGRCIREDKRGSIPNHLPPILQRLNIDTGTWLKNATQFEKDYHVKFGKRSRQCSNSV